MHLPIFFFFLQLSAHWEFLGMHMTNLFSGKKKYAFLLLLTFFSLVFYPNNQLCNVLTCDSSAVSSQKDTFILKDYFVFVRLLRLELAE